jgi:predicted dehydrogenase
MPKPVKLALLGVGDVAQRDYLPEFYRLGDRAQVVAACGRSPARVQQVAESYHIPHWYTDYDRMLAESDADAVINLTPIQLHTETTLAALAAGKHVYTEKPVASTVDDAKRIQAAAAARDLVLVCAPCVLLFPQVRYAQALLQAGTIGPVYSARGYGHLGVPPWQGYGSDPTPFFSVGGGPAFDMGVYPLHTLTGLLGPVRRVTAMVSKILDHFVIEEGPFAGKRVEVTADDNWQMILDFGQGAFANLSANNVVTATKAPPVEIHGLQGTIALDPIDVSAPVALHRAGSGWQEHAPPFAGVAPGRASGPDHYLGIEHLVDCIQAQRSPLLSIEHALHVVDVIETAARAAATGRTLELTSSFRPQPFQAALE